MSVGVFGYSREAVRVKVKVIYFQNVLNMLETRHAELSRLHYLI